MSRCMISARWRRRGWVALEESAVAQDLELQRDEAIVDEIPAEYWPGPWRRRLEREASR